MAEKVTPIRKAKPAAEAEAVKALEEGAVTLTPAPELQAVLAEEKARQDAARAQADKDAAKAPRRGPAKTGNPQADRKASRSRASRAADRAKADHATLTIDAQAVDQAAKVLEDRKAAKAKPLPSEKAAKAQAARKADSKAPAHPYREAPSPKPGYTVRWPHGGYDLLKAEAKDASPGWWVRCNDHNTVTAAKGTKDGDSKGTIEGRRAWCSKCKRAAAK